MATTSQPANNNATSGQLGNGTVPSNTEPASSDVLDFTLTRALADYLNAYTTIPIVIVGLFGNILTIRVFSKQTNWDKGMIHYFYFLAVSDAGCLVIYGIVEWISEGLKFATNGSFYFDLINYSPISCKCLRYIWNVFGSTSAWLVALVTVERLVTITNPLKRDFFTTGRRKKIIATVYALWILYYIPGSGWAYNVKPISENSTDLLCTYYEPNLIGRMVFAYAKLMVMYVIPVLAVLISNFLIVVTLVRGRKSRDQMVATKSKIESKASKTLLIISTAFLVTMMPPTIGWLAYFHLFMVPRPPLNNYDKSLQSLILALGKLANTISMVNYSMNFVVYSYQFDFYRPSALSILGCRPRDAGVNKYSGASSVPKSS